MLLTILHYDLDKLSVLHKASKAHNSSSRADIVGQTPLQLTNWMVPQFPACLHEQARVVVHRPPGINPSRLTSSRKALTDAWRRSDLEVLASNATKASATVTDPDLLGFQTTLTHLLEFNEQLEQVAETTDSENGSSSGDS